MIETSLLLFTIRKHVKIHFVSSLSNFHKILDFSIPKLLSELQIYTSLKKNSKLAKNNRRKKPNKIEKSNFYLIIYLVGSPPTQGPTFFTFMSDLRHVVGRWFWLHVAVCRALSTAKPSLVDAEVRGGLDPRHVAFRRHQRPSGRGGLGPRHVAFRQHAEQRDKGR